MRYIQLIIVSAMLLSVTGCANYDFSRRTVQQGNLLPDAKINRLKIGMSRQDAAILMGTSLLSPMFSSNRWDYAYTLRKGNSPTAIQHISLFFTGNRLVRIEQGS